jgi:hypothetical protein
MLYMLINITYIILAFTSLILYNLVLSEGKAGAIHKKRF